MKIRLILALVGLAIGFNAPALAQEQNTVDPEVRQQIEAVHMKFDEAYNKHDTAAIAALFTLDAVQVFDWTGGGTFFGQEAIKKSLADNFASSPPEVVGKVVQMYAIGDEIANISEWSAGPWKGYSLKIYVRDADTWKIRLQYDITALARR